MAAGSSFVDPDTVNVHAHKRRRWKCLANIRPKTPGSSNLRGRTQVVAELHGTAGVEARRHEVLRRAYAVADHVTDLLDHLRPARRSKQALRANVNLTTRQS